MVKFSICGILVLPMALAFSQPALAEGLCANAEQAQQIAEFYAEAPGTLPVMVARRLGVSPAVVASALDAEQAASAPGTAFADVWAAMSEWDEANFLIMKGANVFEIMSGVAAGAPSTRSQYFNLKYDYPLRGHLRPDQYSSIYALALPGTEDTIVRGVMFFDADGELVFGTFVSGEALKPSAEQIGKFDTVMELVRSQPSVCPATE